MDTGTARSVYVAIGHLVHAVSVIGQAATNDSNSAAVSRDDISASGCANQTCASAPAACTAGISDEDALVVATAIAAASSTLGGDSTFSTISSLTSDLGGLVSTVAPLITRCSIYNELFTN